MASASGDRHGVGSGTRSTLKSKFAEDPEMAALVRTFVDELPQRVQRMQEAWDDAKLDNLRLLAQRLSGSSRNHGFAPLGDAARGIADRIGALRPQAAFRELNRLEDQVRELIAMCERVK